ncbi:GAF domain-containing SpoIIE family protein phosphatase [Kutzneria kofuensis]|uniref:HPt (Histidine-containing phosphotransfer) domain-containing protein n=1 Tax=Kutzneria kofuensis TaxID=103725 RepID=A0A7W9KB06_9PSEU|nr:SpoIIE family protein phosphatase [Kutzneria kofuensis]MBB5889290.1 HPt (histidine-containing phosphotransfer) domain-containing protein [Kutzneria kofuensis]
MSDLERLARLVARQRDQLAQLRARAAADAVLEQAKGRLVERIGGSLAHATQHLHTLAESVGLTPLEMAAELMETTPPPAGGDVPVLGKRLAETRAAVAQDGDALADAVFTEALLPTGAVALAIWRVDPDGTLRMVGERGLGAAEAARWRQLPPQFAANARTAVVEQRQLWLRSGVSDPALAPAAERWPGGARAVLPIRNTRAVLGVMEICWPVPRREFTAGQRTELVALADLCASTLTDVDGEQSWLLGLLDSLVDAVLTARPERVDGEVVDFVVNHVGDGWPLPPADMIGERLLALFPFAAKADGLFERAVRVLETGVSEEFLDDERRVRVARLYDGVAISWRQRGDAELADNALRAGGLGGWEESLVTGRVTWTPRLTEVIGARHPMPLRELAAELGADGESTMDRLLHTVINGRRSATAVFKKPDRQLRLFAEPVPDAAGEVVALRGAWQDVTSEYHTEFALEVTAERADEQQQLAIQLQHAIIPPTTQLPRTAGLEIAVRYQPAATQHLVGGDWYDTVTLPSGQLLLVVGDIAGHGIPVVTGMISMRNALRGLAMTGAPPAQIMAWLNTTAAALPERVSGTVLCGMYDPSTSTLVWARAGHLPPLLVRDGVAALLPLPAGPLLGAFRSPTYEENTLVLAPDDRLVLFTDGLVERAQQDIDECLDDLVATAANPVDGIEEYADLLLAHVGANARDDTCLLALRVR